MTTGSGLFGDLPQRSHWMVGRWRAERCGLVCQTYIAIFANDLEKPDRWISSDPRGLSWLVDQALGRQLVELVRVIGHARSPVPPMSQVQAITWTAATWGFRRPHTSRRRLICPGELIPASGSPIWSASAPYWTRPCSLRLKSPSGSYGIQRSPVPLISSCHEMI